MTVQEMASHQARMIQNIQTVFHAHDHLQPYAAAVDVSVENAAIVLRGQVPSDDLKGELIPAIRQAGVLCQVSNLVSVVCH